MRLNYILLPVLCYVKWQLFQSCVFCCNILPSSFRREIKKVFAQERCGLFVTLQPAVSQLIDTLKRNKRFQRDNSFIKKLS